MRHKFVFLIFLQSIVISLGISAQDQQFIADRVFEINFEPNTTKSIVLENTYPSAANFQVQLNGENFPLTLQNMEDRIKAISKRLSIPDYLAGFRFVEKYTTNANLIHINTPAYDSEIFLNSLGIGYCYEIARSTADIWSELNYNSRVWGLSGHVVSEIELNEKWQVYDADKNVCYKNKKGKVVGVSELAQKKEWIKATEFSKENNFLQEYNEFSELSKFSPATKNKYETLEDNMILEYDKVKDNYGLDFILPALCKLEFPVAIKYNDPIINQTDALKVSINDDCKDQTLKIPLVLNHVRGKGIFYINDEKFVLSGDSKVINQYIDKIQIAEGEGLEFYYFLNPFFEFLQTGHNNLRIDAHYSDIISAYKGSEGSNHEGLKLVNTFFAYAYTQVAQTRIKEIGKDGFAELYRKILSSENFSNTNQIASKISMVDLQLDKLEKGIPNFFSLINFNSTTDAGIEQVVYLMTSLFNMEEDKFITRVKSFLIKE